MLKDEFERLHLGIVGEGKLEARFQEALVEASDIFENAERYERSKDGEISVKVVLEIELTHASGSSFVDTSVRSTLKRPKTLRVSSSVNYKPGEFVAPKVRQAEMFQ